MKSTKLETTARRIAGAVLLLEVIVPGGLAAKGRYESIAWTPDGRALTGATSRTGTPRLRIVATADANDGDPIFVEIVAALSSQAIVTLMHTDASVWFSRDPASGNRIAESRTLRAFEIRPGSCAVLEVPEFESTGALGFFLFARYAIPGQHRVRLDWLRSPVLVELGKRGLNASDEAPNSWTCTDSGARPIEAVRQPEPGGIRDFASRSRIVGDPDTDCPGHAAVGRPERASVAGWMPVNLLDAVTTLLEDPDAQRREAAALAIPRLMRDAPPPDDSPEDNPLVSKSHQHALTAGASDPATAVRLAAICALGQVGDESALEVLSWRRASRELAEIRRAATWAVARIRSRTGQ